GRALVGALLLLGVVVGLARRVVLLAVLVGGVTAATAAATATATAALALAGLLRVVVGLGLLDGGLLGLLDRLLLDGCGLDRLALLGGGLLVRGATAAATARRRLLLGDG
ncbi:hypothetical protein G3I23_29715, partial [Streptomyces sp. SID10115]|uniref:hypothetical protein n=1 Tax=Streptomyces sp. SID10115 TaxID=2706016 RepID=UPI0013CB2FBE